MFGIKIKFGNSWYVIDGAVFASRDDANWALARWRHENEHRSDQTFHVFEIVS
jgi:hypothetical protein